MEPFGPRIGQNTEVPERKGYIFLTVATFASMQARLNPRFRSSTKGKASTAARKPPFALELPRQHTQQTDGKLSRLFQIHHPS
jgi:hypothetical protein